MDSDDPLRFRALATPDSEPQDEKTIEFQRALQAARLSDAEYLKALEELKEDASERQRDNLEKELRDRVRKDFGLPSISRKIRIPESEIAQRAGLNPSFDLPSPSVGGTYKHHEDNAIQTLMFRDAMNATLSKMRENAKLSLEESGVNTIYCAFGFLEWYDADSSDTALHAPLILMPLTIDKELVRGEYHYTVSSSGEDIESNVALAERLQRDFRIKLPKFDEELGVEEYWRQVADAVRNQPNWKVRRWITFGLFSFSRIAMYKGLDPDAWPTPGSLGSLPLLQKILAGAERQSSGHTYAEERDTESAPDHHERPALIADADSSQVSAVLDVLDGKNTVIEGPPGTGKSQTITNIIASALADGKRVLFVAEKMAALNVVKSRLDAAGLGLFCLEMHSTKGGRKAVVDALKRRRALFPGMSEQHAFDRAIAQCEQARRQLADYAFKLNQSAGKTGLTIQKLIWRAHEAKQRTESISSRLDDLRLPHAADMDPLARERHLSNFVLLEKLRAKREDLLGPELRRHPWYGIASLGMTTFQIDDTIRRCEYLLGELGGALQELQPIRTSSGALLKTTVEGLIGLAEIFKSLEAPGQSVLQQHLVFLNDRTSRESLIQFVADHASRSSYLGILPASLIRDRRQPQLTARLKALGTSALALDLLEVPANSFREKLHDASQLLSQVEAFKAQLETFCKRLNANVAYTRTEVDRFLAIARCLATAPSSAANMRRRPGLRQDDAVRTLQTGLEQARRISILRNTLQANLRLENPADAAQIDAHATTIETSGIAAFLSPTFRAAKAFYQSIARSPHKHSRADIGRFLHDFAEYRRLETALRTNSQLRNIFEAEPTTGEQPYQEAFEVAQWIEQLRSAIPVETEADLERRNYILTQNPDEFTLLRAAAQRLVETDPDVRWSDETSSALPEYIEALRRRLGSLEALNRELSSLPDLGNSKFLECNSLASRLEALNLAEDRLIENAVAQQLFQNDFRGADTDVSALTSSLTYRDSLLGKGLEEALVSWLCQETTSARVGQLRAASEALVKAYFEVLRAFEEFSSEFAAEIKAWLGHDELGKADLDDLVTHVKRCFDFRTSLHELVEELRVGEEVKVAGFGPLLEFAEQSKLPVSRLMQAAQRLIYCSALRELMDRDSVLNRFSGLSHESAREQFRNLDKELMDLRKRRTAAALAAKQVVAGNGTGPRSTWTELALVDNECNKTTRHIPVRHLLDRSSGAIQQLMPCFMMSPLSVAQNLMPGKISFDLVVMDEASQMRPEEALGALARASQAVIVGDPKQLPPTMFFDRSTADASDEESEDTEDESILDAAASVISPLRRLKWHYRSRHGSLIEYSNQEFYESDLIVFPSPFHNADDHGVHFQHVADGEYSKGVNLPEVRRVAQAALLHMRQTPNRSLGLVTLNQKQQVLLLEEMDRVFAENPDVEAYRRDWLIRNNGLEPFFVKNLENVQGDERDTIFVSTVYGRDKEKNLTQRFGPINGAGGHRRLNVLFTRAKYQIVVFSSLDPGDIRVDETSSRGVRAFKGFLQFAATRKLTQNVVSGREPDSDFEIAVARRLRSAGYEVDPQVGVCGYFIDMAVRHPKRQGEYILGIECDGATYHSARSVRDRDRLRQEVLERLGWNIHRIWSPDWFRDPAKETKRILDALKGLSSD